MRIGVLGPLQVQANGRPVELGGPLPRRLMAALTAHAGEVVSIDTLVTAMWGETSPPSAVKTVQSYVTRLRAALRAADAGRTGTDLITTAPSGYRLAVAPDAIDATVFVGHVRRAREALGQGDPEQALSLLDEASALWRGAPYGEFADTDFGVAEALRLEEVRLTAAESRLDARLLAGRAAEVVAEAEALCSAHPMHERFWAQLMTALYRCGRQTDALAAFQRIRARLADDVGADPGPALRLLEQQVLRQDPALDGPEPVGAAVPPKRSAAAPAAEPTAGSPPPADAELPVERRIASVLVISLDPAASRPEWADPERADLELRRFRRTCAEAVADAGGTVTEESGIDVVAAFGVLPGYDDHVARALSAALAVHERCDGAGGVVTAGVATGEVLRRGGPGGVLVSGEPVRLAAALRHLAGAGEIRLTERAAASAGRWFDLGPAVEHVVAGGPPLRSALLAGTRRRSRPRRLSPLGRAFVSRRDELDRLEATYRSTVDRSEARLVTILGDAGIGKSTLVEKLLDRLGTATPAPAVRVGHCLGYGEGSTYGAFAEILRRHLGVRPDAPPDQVAQRLAGREILGLTLGLDVAGDVEPEVARARLHAAWVALADDLCAAVPGVLVVEDVHWARRPLLDLIADLVTEVDGPLLVVTTARPEHAERDLPPVPGRRRDELWLDRLPDGQVDAMLALMLGEPPTPALRGLLAPAEGNPFFVEELIATLVDRRLLVPSPAGWRLTGDGAPIELPDSVRSALAARIDCLGPQARTTLQAAAVAGRVFSAGSVMRLVGPAVADVAELVDRDLVRRRRGAAGAAEATFAFKHALTRQVAYDSIPAAPRARLHAAFADLLTGSGNLDEHAPVLAHHYREAARTDLADLAWADDPAALVRVREQAVTWARRAGELAIRRYATDEAVAVLLPAVDLAPDARARAVLWRAVGHAHGARMDFAAYQQAMTRALEACDDPQERAEAYVAKAAAVIDWGIVTAATPPDPTVEGWLDKALSLSAVGTPAHTHALVLHACWTAENLAGEVPRAQAAARRSDDPQIVGDAVGMVEIHATVERRYADNLPAAMSRIPLSGDAGIDDDRLLHPVGASMALGHFAAARALTARHEAVAARQSRADRAHALAWRLEVEAMAGEWSLVREIAQQSPQVVGWLAERPMVSHVRALLLLACAHAAAGDAGESGRLEALADRLTGGAPDDRVMAPRVRLALIRGDLARVAGLMAVAPRRLRPWAQWWAVDLDVTRLDALTALGDAATVEAEAGPLLGTCPLLDAAANRALGSVRHDRTLLARAAEGFHAMDLPAQAASIPVPTGA